MAHAQALTPIKISYQPALYWAMPFHIATEKGWWKEVGLAPEFSTFPAGVPQIAASAAGSWDVGGTGSVPAVLGHVRFGIKTIGLTNDESAANGLVGSAKAAADFAKDPAAALRGKTITLTQNSTADFAVQACLKKYGLKKSDVVDEEHGPGRDHLRAVVEQLRPRRHVGAQHLHAWKRRPAPGCCAAARMVAPSYPAP